MTAERRDEVPAADGVEHLTVSANGLRFHVARRRPPGGARELMLMMHGFPESWYSWRHQLRAFGDRYDCAAPDLRGYGATERPATGYDLDTLAADGAELIAALGYERAVVVGHDWGGAVAWQLAASYPQRVSRLIVLNCPPADVLARSLVTRPRQLRRSLYMFYFQLPRAERVLAADDGRRIARMFRLAARRQEQLSDADIEMFVREMLRPGALRAGLSYYRQAFRGLLRRPLALLRRSDVALPMPGLVIWGRDDPALGSELTHGLERRFCAPLTIRFIDNCGHWTQQEAPDEVNSAIEAFVAGQL